MDSIEIGDKDAWVLIRTRIYGDAWMKVYSNVRTNIGRNVWNNVRRNIKNSIETKIGTDQQLSEAYRVVSDL